MHTRTGDIDFYDRACSGNLGCVRCRLVLQHDKVVMKQKVGFHVRLQQMVVRVGRSGVQPTVPWHREGGYEATDAIVSRFLLWGKK